MGEVPFTSYRCLFLEVSFLLFTSCKNQWFLQIFTKHHDSCPLPSKKEDIKSNAYGNLKIIFCLADLNSCRLNQHVLLSGAHCREPQNEADHINTFLPQNSPGGESNLGLRTRALYLHRSPPSIPKANSENATWSSCSLVKSQTQEIILITPQIPKFLEKVNRVKVFASMFHEVTALAWLLWELLLSGEHRITEAQRELRLTTICSSMQTTTLLSYHLILFM